MLLAALCLQISLLTHPLYLDEEPPELRSARNVLLLFDGAEGLERPVGRTREEAVALAETLVERLAAGAPFMEVAAEHSQAWNARSGAVLGSFPPGTLDPPLDRFLFGAELGDVSQPLVTKSGVHVLQRVETLAGARHVLVAGADEAARERAQALLAEVRAGADFAELARERSDDAATAPRGGALGIYERGPQDRLLKAAVFEAGVGEVVGPIRSPLGWHLVKRVPVDDLDPALRETTLVRAQGILVAHAGAIGAPLTLHRPQEEAKRIALAILRDVRNGKPFAEAAAAFNDDPTGEDRAGDLGWIHRRNPDLPLFMDRLFLMEPGELVEEPIRTSAGYVILRRVR